MNDSVTSKPNPATDSELTDDDVILHYRGEEAGGLTEEVVKQSVPNAHNDSTKRVLSFWYKGGFGGYIDVWITSSAGNNQIRYYGFSAANYDNGQGNVAFHLGSGVNSTTWKRFERNIEADYNSVAKGGTGNSFLVVAEV